MIIEFNEKYEEDVKDLLVELQEYIVGLDNEEYNIITDNYREEYYHMTVEEVNKNGGKIFLYLSDNRVVGLVIALINNESMEKYDFNAPKRGRVSELIVSSEYRSFGIGEKLLNKAEDYLKEVGCKAILIEVFGYNEKALKFYSNKGYHNRMIEVIKTFK